MNITKITYTITLDDDIVEEKKDLWYTEEDIIDDIKKHGIQSIFVADVKDIEVS